MPRSSIAALAAFASLLWLGTGENQSQRSVGFGDGVYKSTDPGRTWSNVGLRQSEHIGRILVDPRTSNVVWVASQGPLWAQVLAGRFEQAALDAPVARDGNQRTREEFADPGCAGEFFQSDGSEKEQQKENQRQEADTGIPENRFQFRTLLLLHPSAQAAKHINTSTNR